MIHPERESSVPISLQRRITMSQSTTPLDFLFSPHASLAALAAHLDARGIFDIVRRGVQIAQKTVKDSPQDKLIDILMTLLSGADSLVQINTLLRSDPALQQSLGRQRCVFSIGRAANAGCSDCRERGSNATGSHHAFPPAQSGDFPLLPRLSG